MLLRIIFIISFIILLLITIRLFLLLLGLRLLLDALRRIGLPLPLRVLLAAAAPGADEFESLWVSATESASLTHVTHVLEQLVTSTLHNKH